MSIKREEGRQRVPETHHVPVGVMLVLDDEDHVEAGEDGGHEVDVLLPLQLVPAAEDGVGGGQHGAPRVERGRDARLRSHEVTPARGHNAGQRSPRHGAGGHCSTRSKLKAARGQRSQWYGVRSQGHEVKGHCGQVTTPRVKVHGSTRLEVDG